MKRAVQIILIIMTIVLWELGAGLAVRMSPDDVTGASETPSLAPEDVQPVLMPPAPRIREKQKEELPEELFTR